MQTTNQQFACSTGYFIHITYAVHPERQLQVPKPHTWELSLWSLAKQYIWHEWKDLTYTTINPRLFQVFAGEGGRKGAQLALVVFMSRPSVFANAAPGVLLSIVNHRSGLFCQCQWILLPAKQKAVKRLLQECHCDKHCIFTGLKSRVSSYCTMPMQHSSSLLERTS